jgi:Ribosome biogenesis protein Nop16
MVKRKAGKLRRTKSSIKKARLQGKLRRAHVPQGVIRDAWDARQTSVQNLARLGLTPSVNAITPVEAPSARRNTATARRLAAAEETGPPVVERADVRAALEREAARPEKVAKRVVRPGEEQALEGMVRAYGEDYEAMARDIKRNYLQWTPAQLRRKCERRQAIRAGRL